MAMPLLVMASYWGGDEEGGREEEGEGWRE